MENPKIVFPDPSELDSSESPSGMIYRVFLDPGYDPIRVETCHVFGCGVPSDIYHNLCHTIVSYGSGMDGEKVLGALLSVKDAIIQLNDCYEEDFWDGHNLRGRWDWESVRGIEERFEGILENCESEICYEET
jgi:hypothetical protein